MCRYLKRFNTFKKINNGFLEFDHALFRGFIKDAKNYRNRSNLTCRKTRFKNITIAHINRFGPPKKKKEKKTKNISE